MSGAWIDPDPINWSYRCSTGHGVLSLSSHLHEQPCPALFSAPDSTVPVPCVGRLGLPFLYECEIRDHYEALAPHRHRYSDDFLLEIAIDQIDATADDAGGGA